MPRKVLIVEDNLIIRQLLRHTLSGDYDVLEASSGAEALSMLAEFRVLPSAILTDIDIAGFGFLVQVRESAKLSQIPVLVITRPEDEESRVKALALGANDFVLKPIISDIVLRCVRNNIQLRETASTLRAIQKDKLTGLYTREAFFELVDAAIKDSEPGYYMLSCFDIDNFKLINDRHGSQEGDRILREIGRIVYEDMESVGGIGARISGDNFAALMPVSHRDLGITRIVRQNRMAFSDKLPITFSVGRYILNDLSLSASALYDRAFIAKHSVKFRYDVHTAYFDDAMLEKMLADQRIAEDMDFAIYRRQFEVWFQPQFNHLTGALSGAEALVRWRHPVKGLIIPDEFIPIFERNGFIYEMDKYVWEESCRYLRKWFDAGYEPVPVSVNISRRDVFRADFIETISSLTNKYSIPVEFLRLEITETAFAESSKLLVEIVDRLIEMGYTVEIDDFGSGYSSLNTLKSVPAQVLKLDMRFLMDDDDSGRGGSILESVVRMAKWLGVTVIAEGIDDVNQADYLASVGCHYMQGFLYARPMPADEYEKYMVCADTEIRLPESNAAYLDGKSLWNPDSMNALIFNSYVGAACIFEYCHGGIELLRVNGKFSAILGDGAVSVEDTLKLNWLSCLSPESLALVRGNLRKSRDTGEEYTGEYVLLNLTKARPRIYLRATMRVIAKMGERMLVYCISENITAQREAEEDSRNMRARLELLTNNLPGGLAVFNGRAHDFDSIRLTYFSDGLCRLFGYTRDEFLKLAAENPLSMVAPSDISHMRESISALWRDNTPIDITYLAAMNGGGEKWINVKAVTGQIRGDEISVNAMFVDVTEHITAAEDLRISEEVNRLAIEQGRAVVCRYDISARRLTVSPNINPIFGVPPVLTDVPDSMLREGKISPDTLEAYSKFYGSILRGEKKGDCLFQRKSTQGWRWIDAHFTSIFSKDGAPVIAVISMADVTDVIERDAAYQRWRSSMMGRDPETYSFFRINVDKDCMLGAVEGRLMAFAPGAADISERLAEYAHRFVFDDDRQRFLAAISRESQMARHEKGCMSEILDFREKRHEGGARWLRLSVDLVDMPSPNDVEAYVMFENIDDAKRTELDILVRAETDPLTGLLNRTAFEERFERIMADDVKLSAMLMIDLDGFKLVNDSFGHVTGDETLIEMGQKLQSAFIDDDLVCRLGGDEFLVFMRGVSDIAAIREKAALACALLHKSFSIEVQLSASIGISVCPDDGTSFDELYCKADAALYHVKETGKDHYALYAESMGEKPAEVTVNNEAVSSGAIASHAAPKRRMLIVDDNEINRDFLANLFSDEFIIETAAEGTAALIRLRRYGAGISVVLLDLLMPGLDGFAVLKKMRENVVTQNIPVIVVSGMNERETCLRAIREGASDYITKPVDAEILRLRVASALSKADNDQLRAQNRYLALQNNETRRLAEARRNSEELSEALQAAERADLAKSKFLSSMSHEIRTPLNAVIGYNTIARSELDGAKTDEERRQVVMKVMDCLTKSEVASRHLLTIINDVLDMSAIESGKMKVDMSPFDFKSLITSLTVLFFSQARAKGVDFEVFFVNPLEEWFVGDQLRINQVLTNLLSNAVKFTPDGGRVTLTITQNVIDKKSIGMRFVVSDTGIGMTKEYLNHIWTPFEQAEASISRRFGGTGLGLSITKSLVSLMEGEINVESQSGVGSTFTVDLTLSRMPQPVKAASYDFSGVNALIVDDDVNTCDYIRLLFNRCGARCETYISGAQAVQAFAAARDKGKPFNVCLVDWRMPGMDGLATISEIRRIALKDLPIVVVTAYDFSEVVDHAQKLGISKFISKPLFQSSLFDLLANISGNQSRRTADVKAKYDFDGARIMLVEDNNMNMEVARHMLNQVNLAVDSAWNGQEAIDIFISSKPGTYKVILMDVHMPVVDGYEATRAIRASKHPDAANVPIIAMTADVFAEDIAEARDAGMNDHIAKPVNVESLYKMLSNYMEGCLI